MQRVESKKACLGTYGVVTVPKLVIGPPKAEAPRPLSKPSNDTSSRDDLFEFVATLKNLDKKTTVETLTGNLKVPELYKADLFAYFSSGSLREAGNYDIFNLESFGYQATKAR